MKRISLKNVAGVIDAHDRVRSRRMTRVSRSFSAGLAVFSFISVFGFAVVAHANSVSCVPSSLPYTWTVSSIKGEYSVLALYPTKLTDEVPVAIPFTVTRSLDSYCGSSDQSVLGFMKGHDFEFEELEVTEAVGHSFHGFDFVVCSFQGC